MQPSVWPCHQPQRSLNLPLLRGVVALRFMSSARIVDSTHGPAGSSMANPQASLQLTLPDLDKAPLSTRCRNRTAFDPKVTMHRRGWLLFALCLTLHYAVVDAEKEYPSKKAMPPLMDPRPYVLVFVCFRLYRHSPIALFVVVLVIAGPFRS
jgi:hypothetical protein